MIAIDPGTRALGFAIFYGDQLTVCGLIRASGLDGMLFELRRGHSKRHDRAWIELPEYRGRGNKADPDDLIKLGAVAGACAMWSEAARVDFVAPSVWKRSIPKDVCTHRILGTAREQGILRGDELHAFDRARADIPASLVNNVVDAIGIGLWAVERWRP